MIPKNSNSNHYLKESQAEKKEDLGPSTADGRTVRPYQADHPWVPHDCSRGSQRRGELLDALVVISDCPHRGARSSAHLADYSRVRRGLSACATRRWGQGRGLLSQAGSPFLLALSQERDPLGDFDWSYPRTVRAHPRNHHLVIRVFYRISHLFTQIEQEGG
jgi:hypothetical protein